MLQTNSFQRLLLRSVQTSHNRIVSIGLLIGLIYLPFWLYDVMIGTLGGGSSLLMVVAFVLGIYMLWQKRHQLAALEVSGDDRWLGHFLIIAGIGIAPFYSSAEWSQRLIMMLILTGIAISSWGVPFFKLYPVPTFLIFMGLFPKPGDLGEMIWQNLMPPQFLERFAAWGGGLGLRLIGYPAVVDNTIVSLPGGSINVVFGCNGFYLAITLLVMSVLLGLWFKRHWLIILWLSILGIVLALLGNLPRIMLMAVAEADWGKEAFDFWHGPWGGQIFSTTLVTIYYYIVMPIIKRSPRIRTKS